MPPTLHSARDEPALTSAAVRGPRVGAVQAVTEPGPGHTSDSVGCGGVVPGSHVVVTRACGHVLPGPGHRQRGQLRAPSRLASPRFPGAGHGGRRVHRSRPALTCTSGSGFCYNQHLRAQKENHGDLFPPYLAICCFSAFLNFSQATRK